MRFSTVLTASLLATVGLTAVAPQTADAHCQVPCGIYGDETKFQELGLDVETVTKAMAQITELSGKDDAQSKQQLGRWIANKESHAQNIMDQMQSYFLAQRIKFPKDESEHEAYFAKLKSIHEVIVYGMKCKQTIDTGAAQAARLFCSGQHSDSSGALAKRAQNANRIPTWPTWSLPPSAKSPV